MTSSVQCWPVNAAASTFMSLTRADISAQLLVDWIPSLPATSASAFMGWPDFLIDVVPSNKRLLLALNSRAGRSERQWKGVLSWMLGVAAARHYLINHERYRWIAPVSAFYNSNTRKVDLQKWPKRIPKNTVKTARRIGSTSNLTPDYLALRSTGPSRQTGRYDWAVAEAKGTAKSLDALAGCPPRWAAQAKNIRVTVRGIEQKVNRHIVVATRVSASRPKDRHLQLRAWNSDAGRSNERSPDLAVEIAAAHLFGLFRGLGLPQNANAIALGMGVRAQQRPDSGTIGQLLRQTERAQAELNANERDAAFGDVSVGWRGTRQTEAGDVDVGLAEPVVRLARQLSQSRDRDQALELLQASDAALDQWWQHTEHRLHPESREETSSLPYGLVARIPFALREGE